MTIVTYEHHGAKVFVEENLKGQHRSHCLCWKCANFKPGESGNCPIAQRLYQICVEENLVTPVFECPKFVDAFGQTFKPGEGFRCLGGPGCAPSDPAPVVESGPWYIIGADRYAHIIGLCRK